MVILATVVMPDSGVAQSTAPRAGNAHGGYVLHVEPLAVGLQYGWAVGGGWRIGPQIIVGPFEGVVLHRTLRDQAKEWASTYVSAKCPLGPRAEVAVAPIGATLVVGNDFRAVYPTAQVGLDYRAGRVFIGSDLRVIRIAGPNGTGDYWTHWIPVRIGLALGG